LIVKLTLAGPHFGDSRNHVIDLGGELHAESEVSQRGHPRVQAVQRETEILSRIE